LNTSSYFFGTHDYTADSTSLDWHKSGTSAPAPAAITGFKYFDFNGKNLASATFVPIGLFTLVHDQRAGFVKRFVDPLECPPVTATMSADCPLRELAHSDIPAEGE
jgi:hypothetical protein